MYVMGSVLRHGSDEQKARYLPKIASGELRLQSFGVTEPTTGTDTTSLKTTAVRDGDHYRISGQKFGSTALSTRTLWCYLRAQQKTAGAKKTAGLSAFIVDVRFDRRQWANHQAH